MNFLHLAGHLGTDPEVRFTSSGLKVTTLRVATRARKKAGEDRTIWWRVTVWGEQFDKMIAHLKKGSPIMAAGELDEPQIYTDRNGNPQISMSMTASSLMFSPFGRGEQKPNQPVEKQPIASENDSSLEEAFNKANSVPGFTSGQGNSTDSSQENDAFPSDEEIPF
jgi:single-strand DNA-binding protein